MTEQELNRKFISLSDNAVQPISRKWEENRLVLKSKLFINKCGRDRAVMLASSDLYDLIGQKDTERKGIYLHVRKNSARIILFNNSRKKDFTLFVLKIKKLLEETHEETHAAIFKNAFENWK
tara:strand:- start:227 stop:592 length:366 start_codon:yes stop_codon:yes gene_type:complete